MSEGDVRARVVVGGVVQGVFFRASARDEAARLGLSGWVRNLPGGDVEAAFEGPEGDVRAAIDWMSQGPPSAIVKHITTSWEEPKGEVGFRLRY